MSLLKALYMIEKVKGAYFEQSVKKQQWRNILLKKRSDINGTLPKVLLLRLHHFLKSRNDLLILVTNINVTIYMCIFC